MAQLHDVVVKHVQAERARNPEAFSTFRVDTLSPFKVFLDGKSPSVPAQGVAGVDYKVGATGIALHRQGQQPLCLVVTSTPDTGWVDLTYDAGFQAPSSQVGPLQYRLIGDKEVYLRGGIEKTSGNFATSFTQVATVPANIRPPSGIDRYFAVYGSGLNASMAKINDTGELVVGTLAATVTVIIVDAMQWFTDS